MSDGTNPINGTEGDGGSIITGGASTGGDSAATPQAWMAQLPDNLKADEGLAKYTTIGDLATAYKDLAGKSEGAVIVPGEGSTDEEKAAFYEAMGIPKDADSYEFNTDDLPEGLQIDEDRLSRFKALAHQAGLSQKAANDMFDAWNAEIAGMAKAQVDAKKAEFEAGVKALKTEWGANYDSNVKKANKAIDVFGGKELAKELETLNLANNPVIIRLLHSIGERMSEDTALRGAGGKSGENRPTDALGRPMLVKPV